MSLMSREDAYRSGRGRHMDWRYLYVMCMLSFRDVSYAPRRLARTSRTDPAVQSCIARQAGQRERPRQSVIVLALIAVVVVLDQAVKWWAWRHVPWATINSGGDLLVGRTIGAWYAGPVTGALLDLLDVGLLSIAVSVLARYRA